METICTSELLQTSIHRKTDFILPSIRSPGDLVLPRLLSGLGPGEYVQESLKTNSGDSKEQMIYLKCLSEFLEVFFLLALSRTVLPA